MAGQTALRDLLKAHTMAADPALVRREKGGALRCLACGHSCLMRPGRSGVCKVRFHSGEGIRAPHGYVAGLQVDPVEKKPFYHAFPGSEALSFGMLGCDLHCGYCQNWVSSQTLRDPEAVARPQFRTAGQLVGLALEYGAPLVVSTYNEPLITADWAVEVFREARRHGLVCGFVSNGNATPEVIAYLRPYVQIYKVDLKSFRDKTYRRLGCKLSNVLETIATLHDQGFWVEVVTLLVPGLNDGQDELKDMASFLVEVSPDIPWHITAFHPDYKMTDRNRTQAADLERAYDAGKAAGLRFVYLGNLPGRVGGRESTYCPACGTELIRRHGFQVMENHLRDGHCPGCQAVIPGVWETVDTGVYV